MKDMTVGEFFDMLMVFVGLWIKSFVIMAVWNCVLVQVIPGILPISIWNAICLRLMSSALLGKINDVQIFKLKD